MPKKSKRRAKTSGGGGSGKARESGGREGNGSASAKNSADANNWDDDGAGILTSGAVRMLLKRGATNKEHSFAKKHAPILQVVDEVEPADAVADSYLFCLSDGEHRIWANTSRTIDRESFNFAAKGQLTNYSTIRLMSYFLSFNATTLRSLVIINRAAVVETKVEGVIGSPTFLGATCIEAPAVDAVDDIPSSPAGCVPYSQRLKVARGVLAESGCAAAEGDMRLVAKQCCGALNLPRNLTEGFRSLFILHCCVSLEQALTRVVTESNSGDVRAFETYLDSVEGCTQLFKSIASDMTESIDIRAMAVYACSMPSAILPCAAPNHMNYLRRFIAMSKEVCLHDLPAPMEVAGGHPDGGIIIRICFHAEGRKRTARAIRRLGHI